MRAYTRTVHILYEERVARAYIRENAHKMNDTHVKYGEIFYSDIRYYSWNKKAEDRNTWFDDLTLPNKNLTIYVTKCVHGNRCNNDNQVKVMDKVTKTPVMAKVIEIAVKATIYRFPLLQPSELNIDMEIFQQFMLVWTPPRCVRSLEFLYLIETPT